MPWESVMHQEILSFVGLKLSLEALRWQWCILVDSWRAMCIHCRSSTQRLAGAWLELCKEIVRPFECCCGTISLVVSLQVPVRQREDTARCVSRSGSDTYPLNGIPFQFGSVKSTFGLFADYLALNSVRFGIRLRFAITSFDSHSGKCFRSA